MLKTGPSCATPSNATVRGWYQKEISRLMVQRWFKKPKMSMHMSSRDRGGYVKTLSEEVPSLLLFLWLWRFAAGRCCLWLRSRDCLWLSPQVHCCHTGRWWSRRPRRCWRWRGFFLQEMRRGFGRWSFSWEIQSSLVNAQITNLSQKQTWSEHV